jgi:hypothetical protein
MIERRTLLDVVIGYVLAIPAGCEPLAATLSPSPTAFMTSPWC